MHELSIAEASDLLRRKEISPVDLTNSCLARIEQLDPTLNAFITVMHDSALAQAREAEQEFTRPLAWTTARHSDRHEGLDRYGRRKDNVRQCSVRGSSAEMRKSCGD